MTETPFTLTMPEKWTTGFVFASPHSGKCYPTDLLAATRLTEAQIRSSEDAFVDRLFSMAPKFGAPLLTADAPRAYVDLNRSADELDPALIEGVPPHKLNPRVASGLGVIPRVVANGRSIYPRKISMRDARQRIDTVWRPYHSTLDGLMQECRRLFGQAILIDCHSMPSEAIGAVSKGRQRPDIVLGDRFGASADSEIVEIVEAIFSSVGFNVARNTPFAGAYTTQAYGRPSRGLHVLQVEIDRSLYMDEENIQPLKEFATIQQAMNHVVAELAAFGRRRDALAAE